MKYGIARVIRLWPQTLIPPIITSFLYFSIFGHVIGHRVGSMEGYNYITFIAPGLIMMQIVMASFTGTVTTFFSAKFNKDIEELLVSPATNFTIMMGYVSVGVMRGLLTGLCVLGVSFVFGAIHFHSAVTIVFITLLSSSVFAFAGLINAVYARKFDDIAIIPNFILTPLVYFGGVFYSAQMLPKAWRIATYIDPIYYIIHAFRYGFLGIHYQHIATSLIVILAMLVILSLICWYIFKIGAGLRS
ncbi:MAG: ABC transporter permease [Gammaproteobacteria bacterium]|nr:ABC transporter permease [Gammaproteobacteria bacterium]MCH9744635.1 ABC transporter permease [Gammaproteobacteria bacterium]